MNQLSEMIVSFAEVKRSMFASRNSEDTVYRRSLNRASSLIDNHSRKDSIQWEGASHILTKLEDYFKAKINTSLQSLDKLSEEVDLHGLVMEKAWVTSGLCSGLDALSHPSDCSNCQDGSMAMSKVLDMIITRNKDQMVVYNPHVPSETIYFVDQFEPSAPSHDYFLPVGLFIERKALDLIVVSGNSRVLHDVEGSIIVTGW